MRGRSNARRMRRIAAADRCAGIIMTVSNARKMQNTRHRSVGFRTLAIIAGFIGGGFLNYYTVVLLSTQTDLSEYSWNVASERNVIVAVAVANFGAGRIAVCHCCSPNTAKAVWHQSGLVLRRQSCGLCLFRFWLLGIFARLNRGPALWTAFALARPCCIAGFALCGHCSCAA